MSWLNDELPHDWPSNHNERREGQRSSRDDHSSAFSTSQSDSSSVGFGPTVAIQANATEEQPAWRDAVKAPKPKVSSARLTQLFQSPPLANILPNTNGSATAAVPELGNNRPTTLDELTNISMSTSSSLSSSSPPIERQQPRFKVFGRPDTYTNERLGNLLSSMGQRGTHASHSKTSEANESDVDIAENLKNEGRKVLQGLVPLRSSLQEVREDEPLGIESSLDELEQQLTRNGTTRDLSQAIERIELGQESSSLAAKFDTTSSSLSSSRTLDSLPLELSNWDTMGPVHHMQTHQKTRNLHRASSQTLVGSGAQPRRKRSTEMAQLDEEISLLGIQDPLLQRNGRQVPSNTDEELFDTLDTEFPLSTDERTNKDMGKNNLAGSILRDDGSSIIPSTSQRSSSVQSRVSNSSAASGYGNGIDTKYQIAYQDTTPDTIVRRHLRWPRPHLRSPLEENDVSKSIINKNVSFSAGYELLAQLIREKAPQVLDPTTLDSLDLSGCDLESIIGLEEFVPNITTLFLNDNHVRSLQGLPFKLVHLDMSANHLSFVNTFPTCFVSTLILSHNELRDLEPLANMRALSSLDVSNNQLTSLRGIENLTALRTLNVNDNKLKTLNLNLGMLSELSAARNQISSFKINSPNLEVLDLEDNQIFAVAEVMPNLRELNLRFNNATIDFSGLESLETVLLDGNKAAVNLETVAGNLVTFSWEQSKGNLNSLLDTALLTSCRDLKLGGSNGGWPFASNVVFSAQHLDLSMSNIRELPSNLDKQFPFLRSLNLAFNKLSNESYMTIASCSKLERLSLFANRLEITGEIIARAFPRLRWLDCRNQGKQSRIVQHGEFATDIYVGLTEPNSQVTEISNIAHCDLQWVDGKWTKSARKVKPTTRPGFPSALFPSNWNPPTQQTECEETNENSMISILSAWDVLEAMYVHHFQNK